MTALDLFFYEYSSSINYPGNVPLSEKAALETIKKYLGKSPKYWEDLYSMYNIPENKQEVREFIATKSSDFQNYLLEIYFIINNGFSNLGLTLKLTKDFEEYQMLKIYIKTNLSPEEAIAKVDEIEDIVFAPDDHELWSNLMISVEFE